MPTAQKVLRATVSVQAPLIAPKYNKNVFFRAETKIYFRPTSNPEETFKTQFIIESRTNKKLVQEVQFFQIDSLKQWSECPVFACYENVGTWHFGKSRNIVMIDPMDTVYNKTQHCVELSRGTINSNLATTERVSSYLSWAIDACLEFGMVSLNQINQSYLEEDELLLFDFWASNKKRENVQT